MVREGHPEQLEIPMDRSDPVAPEGITEEESQAIQIRATELVRQLDVSSGSQELEIIDSRISHLTPIRSLRSLTRVRISQAFRLRDLNGMRYLPELLILSVTDGGLESAAGIEGHVRGESQADLHDEHPDHDRDEETGPRKTQRESTESTHGSWIAHSGDADEDD